MTALFAVLGEAAFYGLLVILYTLAIERKKTFPRGSSPYRKAFSAVVKTSAFGIIVSLYLSMLYWALGGYVLAALHFVFAIAWGYFLRDVLNDDDWFRDQRQRFGDYLKKIGRRLVANNH